METGRYTNAALEKLLGQEVSVLDHGFVRVIDYMGGDESIVQAARVSYGAGTKKTSEDRALIRYLMRHRHTTPLEMCEIKLHVKLPIFVARQWIRHRTANVNEYSARYSILDREFYVPSEAAEQSRSNNQGRGEIIDGTEGQLALDAIDEHSRSAYELYLKLLNTDEIGRVQHNGRASLARELARIVLPTNFYTQWYWKIDLHNLLNFISLRIDSHAQFEIRKYAEAIADVARIWVPQAFEAFEDYRLNGRALSAQEKDLLASRANLADLKLENTSFSEREFIEFLSKFPES